MAMFVQGGHPDSLFNLSVAVSCIAQKSILFVSCKSVSCPQTERDCLKPLLIQFVQSDHSAARYFVAPYIWVWTVATYYLNLFYGWKFDDYENVTKFDGAAKLAICTPEDFERFNGFFRALKSQNSITE